ncbi:MAG: class I SAM-dependent methyltransferase [Proteobacteria bacterium]|nr:class I SAM-dependent methyltransferase [Pseudomonadota bacterium]
MGSQAGRNTDVSDLWLDRWLPRIVEAGKDGRVFEVGCGEGRDSVVLLRAGLSVTGIDINLVAVERAREKATAFAQSSRFLSQDVRAVFPVEPGSIDVVLASLSLHYFSWAETVDLVRRLRAIAKPSGVLLARFNATDDYHFGARRHRDATSEIEPDYYLVEGSPKRFLNRLAVERLLSECWRIEAIEHLTINRYTQPKRVWEAFARAMA